MQDNCFCLKGNLRLWIVRPFVSHVDFLSEIWQINLVIKILTLTQFLENMPKNYSIATIANSKVNILFLKLKTSFLFVLESLSLKISSFRIIKIFDKLESGKQWGHKLSALLISFYQFVRQIRNCCFFVSFFYQQMQQILKFANFEAH